MQLNTYVWFINENRKSISTVPHTRDKFTLHIFRTSGPLLSNRETSRNRLAVTPTDLQIRISHSKWLIRLKDKQSFWVHQQRRADEQMCQQTGTALAPLTASWPACSIVWHSNNSQSAVQHWAPHCAWTHMGGKNCCHGFCLGHCVSCCCWLCWW